MPSGDGDSFLPRIQSVFYAVFDLRQGPKIVYQVPEGLIAVSNSGSTNGNSTSASGSPVPATVEPEPSSRNSSSSLRSPIDRRANSFGQHSPNKRSASSNRTLFHFDEISTYVIPRSALCGRLVICATKKYRIIGFPVELRGDYERNYFRYNLCFVFERTADLSCYEPIVRKTSRVLSACEEESGFLSKASTSPAVHAILEQLYEDLNSYSETSIQIDEFNSIELKIFPFYPNPPPVQDWQVPLALINLSKRIESNWDLTMGKVCKFIDGTNHVSRIAALADCDLELTRQAISHFLYYQVIMMIDIFQYSNMYTLRKNIQWLADEPHVKEECGPYVTKPGREVTDWPKLLHLYSRLRPGKTVMEWMEEYNVNELGVDVRRFTSFGVIKGFLRRVHRWPVLLPEDPDAPVGTPVDSTIVTRARVQSFSSSGQVVFPETISPQSEGRTNRIPRGRPFESPKNPSPTETSFNPQPMARRNSDASRHRSRKSSAAERILEKLQLIPRPPVNLTGLPHPASNATPRTSPLKQHAREDGQTMFPRETRRQHTTSMFINLSNGQNPAPPASPLVSAARPRYSRSPSAPPGSVPQIQASISQQGSLVPSVTFPPDLLSLLDGEHHTDELATRFEAGWPLLEQWLMAAGNGKGDGDFGRVLIIYR
ncbi:hypothetical protein HWV62_35138 [Athelia sp. TMB]|nr:hypothetical protein HWV62_35138 [Athelia sp. TMB]